MAARMLRVLIPPALLGVAFLAVWELAVRGLGIEPFVLPSPSAIGSAFGDSLAPIWTATAVTGGNALVGLIAGTVVGVLLAVIAALVNPFEKLTAPVVTALSVIPIVALAPVLYSMFGTAVETARQLVAGIAVAIPVFINALRGFHNVRPIHREIMHVSAASPWQLARHLIVPSAVPYIMTGLRTASSLAVISALIAEYFGGPVGGLGKAITTAASSSNYTMAWAFVLGAIALGLIFYAVTAALEHLISRH